MSQEPHPTLPKVIRVERDRAMDRGRVHITVDGEPFPYAFSVHSDDPVSVNVDHETIPCVRLTLLAETVEVADRFLEGAKLVHHDHDGDGDSGDDQPEG